MFSVPKPRSPKPEFFSYTAKWAFKPTNPLQVLSPTCAPGSCASHLSRPVPLRDCVAAYGTLQAPDHLRFHPIFRCPNLLSYPSFPLCCIGVECWPPPPNTMQTEMASQNGAPLSPSQWSLRLPFVRIQRTGGVSLRCLQPPLPSSGCLCNFPGFPNWFPVLLLFSFWRREGSVDSFLKHKIPAPRWVHRVSCVVLWLCPPVPPPFFVC